MKPRHVYVVKKDGKFFMRITVNHPLTPAQVEAMIEMATAQ